jgi:uncharacterized protein
MCDARKMTATPNGTETTDELVDRFIDAIERGDVDTVLAIYADDARIWHNFDQIEVTPRENARQISWFSSRLVGMTYGDIRRIAFPGGIVQQHVLRGTARNGESVAVHAMLRIDIAEGRIVRLEEYLDPAQAAALSAPASD